MEHISYWLNADDANLLGDDIDTINKNTETLIYAIKEVGQEINAGKSKYMLIYSHQNVGQNRVIKIANRSFENVTVQLFGDDSNKSKFDSRGN
jgi:hypothetical protein